MERLKELIEAGALPFLLATGTAPKMSITRLIESIIIAIVTGIIASGASVYVTAKLLENDISHIMEIQKEIKEDIKDAQKGLYNHVNKHEGN